MPAPGERAAEAHILRHIPDVDAEPEAWAGRTLLVAGAGHSAQTAIRDLVGFAERQPGTRVIWALRRTEPTWQIDPADPLPERAHLTERAVEIAAGASDAVEVLTGVTVAAVRHDGEKIEATLERADGSTLTRQVDLILSLTGYIGDASLHRQLQVHECYATSGPMRLAAALLARGSANCLEQVSHGADTLTNPEPDFYILGIKSYGRSPGFLMQVGWSQVGDLFPLLVD